LLWYCCCAFNVFDAIDWQRQWYVDCVYTNCSPPSGGLFVCVTALRCPILTNPVPWQNWMAAYLRCTLRMKTLFHGWPVMVHDMHTRRRRLHYCTSSHTRRSTFQTPLRHVCISAEIDRIFFNCLALTTRNKLPVGTCVRLFPTFHHCLKTYLVDSLSIIFHRCCQPNNCWSVRFSRDCRHCLPGKFLYYYYCYDDCHHHHIRCL